MSRSTEPFRDRATEDHVRDYVLIGIFGCLVGVLIVFGYIRITSNDPRPTQTTVAEPSAGSEACPPLSMEPVVAKESSEALALLSQRLERLSADWIIAEYISPPSPEGATLEEPSSPVVRHVYLKTQLVGQVVLKERKDRRVEADIRWQCQNGANEEYGGVASGEDADAVSESP